MADPDVDQPDETWFRRAIDRIKAEAQQDPAEAVAAFNSSF